MRRVRVHQATFLGSWGRTGHDGPVRGRQSELRGMHLKLPYRKPNLMGVLEKNRATAGNLRDRAVTVRDSNQRREESATPPEMKTL